MTLRHELKYQISNLEHQVLRKKLKAILKPDPHMKPKNSYNVRTLYFDDVNNSAFYEKQAGIYQRKKYRLRIYNHNDTVIKFERKSKISSHILKEIALLKRWEADRIVSEDYNFLAHTDNRLLKEFYVETRCKLMHPVVIVEYDREAYVEPIGNVRITFDSNLRTGFDLKSFFDEYTPIISSLDQTNTILEIKYNEVLPEYIRGLFPDTIRPRLAIGKFVICRNQQVQQRGMVRS